MGNHQNPRFLIEIDRFSWKINEKSWVLTISQGFLGNLGVEGDHPPKMCAGLNRTTVGNTVSDGRLRPPLGLRTSCRGRFAAGVSRPPPRFSWPAPWPTPAVASVIGPAGALAVERAVPKSSTLCQTPTKRTIFRASNALRYTPQIL